MNKKVSIELTQEEYDAVCKLWETAKKSPVMPSKALNFDDFCKEIIMGCTNPLGGLSGANMEDLMSSLGDLGNLDNLKDLLGSFGKKMQEPKKEEKKEEVPDDQKYKS